MTTSPTLSPSRAAAVAHPTHLVGVCRPTWPARWRGEDGGLLVHAVPAHRDGTELHGEPELAVCGAVVAVQSRPWSTPAAAGPSGDAGRACPACSIAVGPA